MLKALQEQWRAAMTTARELREKHGNDFSQMDAQDEKAYSDAIELADSLRTRIEVVEREEGLAEWGNRAPAPAPVPATTDQRTEIPARRSGALRAFRDDQQAYLFGNWLMAAVTGNDKARQVCARNGIQLRAMTEGTPAAGGYTVPEIFSAEIINLVDQYGVFRRNCGTRTMTSDTLSIPVRDSGLTPYFVGENATITESTMGWSRALLTAKKLAVLTKTSSELSEDSIVNVADIVANEIALAFATREDDCGFMGDGAGGTYGGITGLTYALVNLSATRANIAGLSVAATDTKTDWTKPIVSDFSGVAARLAAYADNTRSKWFASRAFVGATMERLALAAGGVTAAEMMGGFREPRFLGFPIDFVQQLPRVPAADSAGSNAGVLCLLGDISMAAKFGDRRTITIATSEHLNFAEDEIAIRGTERFDINVHSVGNASATAALRVGGPVVGLLANP